MTGGDWGIRSIRVRRPKIEVVVSGSDQNAPGVLDALRELGHKVPDDIAVTGVPSWDTIAGSRFLA